MFKNYYYKNKTLWLIFSIFLIISLWGLINHAPWRDEAQSWLIVRDLNLAEVFNQTPYEGTPPLWLLIIFPLAKLGLPYASELIVHYIFALSLIFILIFFSPLPKKIKLILPFTYYFLFEYTIIARNYNLTALLLFTIASMYTRRFKIPIVYAFLIFLLAWSNVHSLAMASLLSGFFIYEILKKRKEGTKLLTAVTIMCSGIVSAIVTLIPQIDQYSNINFLGWQAIPISLASSLLPYFKNPLIPTYLSCLISMIWVPIVIFILKKNESRILFIFSYFWLAFIFLFKNAGEMRHFGLILIFFIFAWWIDIIKEKKKLSDNQSLKYKNTVYLLVICLVLNSIYAGYFYLNNLNKNFSGSKEMAQYIKDTGLEKEEIATYPSYSGTALLPYLPDKEFYQMEIRKKGSFMTWNNSYYIGASTPYPILKKDLKNYYSLRENRVSSVLLLTTIPEWYDPELKLIYKNKKETVKKDEFFYLYRLYLQ